MDKKITLHISTLLLMAAMCSGHFPSLFATLTIFWLFCDNNHLTKSFLPECTASCRVKSPRILGIQRSAFLSQWYKINNPIQNYLKGKNKTSYMMSNFWATVLWIGKNFLQSSVTMMSWVRVWVDLGLFTT